MEIRNHLLYAPGNRQVSLSQTSNKRGLFTPKYLVVHYTAATSMASTINWFHSPQSQASAHLLIGRDGTVYQFAAFNVVTWHAGKSSWGGLQSLNQHAIGIELVNGGRLEKKNEQWRCPGNQRRIPAEEVLLAVHKNEDQLAAWRDYTEPQQEVCQKVVSLLVHAYELQDILGHDDISPLRKSDPGPAFPMSSFRAKATERKGAENGYITTSNLNIRSGPGVAFGFLTRPLPAGTKVLPLKQEGSWVYIEVPQMVHGIKGLQGWVARQYLV